MNFRFCGQILENVTFHPYLGVQLDSKLCWKGHMELLVKGASKILGLIRRNFWFCDEKVKTTLYKTMVRAKLEYASSIRTYSINAIFVDSKVYRELPHVSVQVITATLQVLALC